MVDLRRGAIAQSLVWSACVVDLKVGFQPFGDSWHRLILIRIQVLVFDGPPERLHKDVGKHSPADLYTGMIKERRKALCHKLTAMIGIKIGHYVGANRRSAICWFMWEELLVLHLA